METTNNKRVVPSRGYILTEWKDNNAYRSTALAYMQRKGFLIVRNIDGNTYHIDEIQNSIIKSNRDENFKGLYNRIQGG